MADQKPVHSLILDTGPIIKNEPAVSTLIARAEQLFTVPAIISEIRDKQTRSRLETTLLPFLTIRSPSLKGVKLVTDFARRTGDLATLSRPDIEIIALTYDLECERNNGDWRLRSTPGQTTLNGSPPCNSNATDQTAVSKESVSVDPTADQTKKVAGTTLATSDKNTALTTQQEHRNLQSEDKDVGNVAESTVDLQVHKDVTGDSAGPSELAGEELSLSTLHTPGQEALVQDDAIESLQQDDDSASDSDGWITPSNLKRQQAKDAAGSTTDIPEQGVMEAAVLTTDYAMQNVILQMNINLLSTSLQRVKQLKSWVLRCHTCFQVCKDMNKQFCPRCGQATLQRVACSTNAKGVFRIHLKKNYQWNTRGDRYSVPKPAHGSTNGRVTGGGKGGWGHDLILAEDQKEYERARVVERKQRERSLMDEDYLPSILTGDRQRAGGRVKVGAGRNVNSRKRHN